MAATPGVVVAGLVAVALTAAPAPAEAIPLTVTVTIEQVNECCGGEIDTGTGADFYGRVFIAGQKTEFGVYADNEDVINPNWVATGVIDHTAAYADVVIEIFDEDNGLNFADNQIDVSVGQPTIGNTRSLDLFVGLHDPDNDCTISGEAYGVCNQTISSFGNEGTDVGNVSFRISVSEPPQAPNLHVGCMHTPLWPQPGQTVTLTASAWGDQPDGQALPAKLADRLEVWFSTDGGATRQIAASTGKQMTFSTNKTAGLDGSTFSYGCRVVDAGSPAFSGWKSVQVGSPPQGQAVPVLLGNSIRERAMDVVLFPVTQNVRRAPFSATDTNLLTYPVYTGPTDPNFLTHALAAVNELMREQLVLDNQRQLNIWIARDGGGTGGTRDLRVDTDGNGSQDGAANDTTGDGIPDGDGITDTCQHLTPANLGSAYGFANVRALLHPATPAPGNTNTLRECASNGVFSAEAGETNVFIHETGHAGWGLGDEYCCDGGYRPPDVNPNVYGSLQACQDDVENLGGVDSDCRGFDTVRDTDANPDAWVSDPANNDLMNDNQFARRADRRRMSYTYGLCTQGKF